MYDEPMDETQQAQHKDATVLQTPPASSSASSASASSVSPSSIASTLRMLHSVAVPVGHAARHVFRSWVGALAAGWRGAVHLRNEWRETQQARRKLAHLAKRYAEEKKRAKEREKNAMDKLQQLEQQIQWMQQQYATLTSYSEQARSV